MKFVVWFGTFALTAVLASPGTVRAGCTTSCTDIPGDNLACDAIVSGTTVTWANNPGQDYCPGACTAPANKVGSACDVNTDCGVGGVCGHGDGTITMCGSGSNDTITGTSGNDVLCGKGGDDTIYGNGGVDVITGGSGDDTIYMGPQPYSFGSGGYADGGGGHDDIFGTNRFFGSWADDTIIGGAGDDVIYTGSGRDVVKGGGGDDFITAPTFLQPTFSADIGNLFCGGDGDDQVYGFGTGHQCVDGGDGNDVCGYSFYGNYTATSADFGSQRHCETIASGYPFGSRSPSCGCEKE